MATNAETIARLNRLAGFKTSPSGAPLSPSGQGSLRQPPPVPSSIPRNLPRGLPEPRQSLPVPPPPSPTAPTNIPSSLGSRFGGAATALSNGAARASGALAVGASLATAAQNSSTRNLVNAGLDVASVVAFSIPNPISQAVGWALQGGKLLFNLFTPPENTAQKIGEDIPPPFTGGQSIGVFYNIFISYEAYYNGDWRTVPFHIVRTVLGPITGVEEIHDVDFTNGFWFYLSSGERIREGGHSYYEKNHQFYFSRADGLPDTGGDPPPISVAPIAPAPNNTGQPNFDLQGINDKLDSLNNAVTGLSDGLNNINEGIQGLRLPQANNGMPMARPNYVPQPLLNPNEKLNPKIEETPQDKPSFKPLFNPFENGAIPSFEASPFISGVSNPDDQFNPRDSKTGLTREQFDQRILEERQKTRDKQEANAKAAKKNDDKINQELAKLNPQLQEKDKPKKILSYTRIYPDTPTNRVNQPTKNPQPLKINQPIPNLNPNYVNERFKPPTDCQFSCSNLANCFTDITVDVFDECGDGVAKTKQITIQVLPKDVAKTRASFAELLELRSNQCSVNIGATFPDWWQVRIGADRPQAVVIYREWDGKKFGAYKHSISIPYYSKPKGFKPSLPTIKKGSFFGILKLKDNSQVIVNCESIQESKRVISSIKKLIGSYAKDSYVRYGESGQQFKKVTTRPVRLDYYSKGALGNSPDWSIRL